MLFESMAYHADGFYVTWGAPEGAVMAPGQCLPPHGKLLGRLDSADLKQVIQKVRSEGFLSAFVCIVCSQDYCNIHTSTVVKVLVLYSNTVLTTYSFNIEMLLINKCIINVNPNGSAE